MYRAKACEFVRGRNALARLSADYQAYLVGVRAYQYHSIQATHDAALFDRPELTELLHEHLGFCYSEFVEVRDHVQNHSSDSLTSRRDLTADIFLTAEREDREPTASEADVLRVSLIEMVFLPADRAIFSAKDIAGRCGLSLATVQRVLDRFSLDFERADPVSAVIDFLHAKSPFHRRQLVRSGDDHALVSAPVGGESFRSSAEAALKSTKGWARYDAARCAVSEALAVAALERALGTAVFEANFRYLAPGESVSAASLDGNSTDPLDVGVPVESDALFIVEDVAICLEVKGRSVAEPARRGDLARLKTEIRSILGSGAKQARRLETLFRDNGGVWDPTGVWIDLGNVREVRTVVIGLDYFGRLGVGLGDLADSDLLVEGTLPWIASLHDLDVISRVVDRPTEFLLYLRRRPATAVAQHYSGSDELDLFMLFMSGGLYVEDDPDEVHRKHPRTPEPTRTARSRHQEAAQPTLVATHTDPLDAWMYSVEGKSPEQVEKPVFNVDPGAADLVDFLADGRKPGWLRIGADILGLDGRAQRKLTSGLQRIVAKTCTDSQAHTITHGYASTNGFTTLFAGTIPKGGDPDLEANRLLTYMTAKKHQVQSDSALGLLLNHRGRIELTMYLNEPAQADCELDELGRSIGLRETWKRPKRHPSLSEKKRKRRRKRQG